MTQSKLESLLENVLNVISGLILSIFVVQPVVFWYYDIHLEASENIMIAVIFTVVSIIRGYVWRRIFNKKLLKRMVNTLN